MLGTNFILAVEFQALRLLVGIDLQVFSDTIEESMKQSVLKVALAVFAE